MASLKKLVYIFIPILAVLLMSHNTFATDLSPNVTLKGTYTDPRISCLIKDGVAGNSWWTSYANYCFVNSNSTTPTTMFGVTAISFQKQSGSSNFNVAYGDYIQIQISVTANDTNVQPQMYYLPSDSGNLEMISVRYDGSFTASQGKELIVTYYGRYLGSGATNNIVMGDGIRDFLATFNNVYIVGGMSLSVWTAEQAASPQDIANAIENTAEQNTQNAANNSQNAGSSSSQDATTATSSLISAIGGFVGAVTTASPTNCVVNFTTTQLSIGNMDLCANPVPAYVQIIGSIILICAAIPLAIVLFNRFIGLFRSFQG